MQMISRKIFVFPVFVCILKNAPKNILQCLIQRKKNNNNKTHPNTTGMDKKPTTTSTSHPTNPPPPRQATPQPARSPTPITSNPSAHLHPSLATQNWQKSNPNRISGKKKKKKPKPTVAPFLD